MGKVEFGGVMKDVCLAYTPEARTGDYVLVHVGFAISVVDESEAEETLNFLREIEAEVSDEPLPANPDPPGPRPPASNPH